MRSGKTTPALAAVAEAEGELPAIDGGERDEGRGAALLIADPPRPAAA